MQHFNDEIKLVVEALHLVRCCSVRIDEKISMKVEVTLAFNNH
tara:strand:- start:871 stop:999 length:129 start_codon:yes stop_codon:yes gene_type:complete